MQPKQDVIKILQTHGHDFTLKNKSIGIDKDPIYGQGTVGYNTSTIKGLFDQYNLAEELWGFGRIETGDARIITKGGLTINDEDRLIDNTGTFEVTRVLNWDYQDEEAYKIVEVNKIG